MAEAATPVLDARCRWENVEWTKEAIAAAKEVLKAQA
jgi:hypothetical protein